MRITEFLIYDFKHRLNTSQGNKVPDQGRPNRNGRAVRTNRRSETTHLVTVGDGSENKSEKLK